MAHTAVPVVIDAGAPPPAASEAPLVLEHPHTSTGLDNRKLLMWAFLASDCMFFGTLIATYMVYKNRSLDGPLPRETFDVPYTSVSAFVLLLSSLTMVLALASIQKGDERRMRIWLSATALLGCVFLGGQFYEFTSFYHDGLTLSRNLFGSTFFTLTGFHGTHVFIGVFWLGSLVVQSFRGRLHQEHSLLVEIAGLYWHFVDIVWILIFTLVYLIPD
jgi:heme/copper-type cytochrome/quinol oxidase subunit 3